MMFSVVGCADNNDNSLPIIPNSSNLETNTDGVLKEDSSDSSTEIEKKDESLGNGDDSAENDDSSSNGNENKPSNEAGGWIGFY